MKGLAKTLRIIAIVLMGLTTVMTLLGGIGTVCIAWFPERWESLAVMAPYKPIYQTATIITLAAAIAGGTVTYGLIRGRKKAYTTALIVLLVGLSTAGVKMYFSNMVRGSVAPTHIRFILTSITLLVLLLLRIPGVWSQITSTGAEGPPDSGAAASVALILGGVVTLTTPLWAGPTHTIDGYNWVLALRELLIVGGGTMIVLGLGLLARRISFRAGEARRRVLRLSTR